MGIRLMQGDCLERMKEIDDGSVDMVLADLPYGTTRNKWDSIIPLETLWREYRRVAKRNAAICLMAQSPFDKVLAMSNLGEFRYQWVIEKTSSTGFLNAGRMPLKAHELMLVFYRGLPVYNPQMREGFEPVHTVYASDRVLSGNYGEYHGHASGGNTDRLPIDVLTFKWDKQTSNLHPVQKPVALMEYFIRTYTDESMTVLDNTMGSGTTGVAAMRAGRSFIGIEKDKDYFEIAKRRIYEEKDLFFDEEIEIS